MSTSLSLVRDFVDFDRCNFTNALNIYTSYLAPCLLGLLGDGERVMRLHIVRNGVQILTHVRHVPRIVLKDQAFLADVHGDKPTGTLFRVGAQILGERSQRDTIVAVSALREASGARNHIVGVIAHVVGQAVIVAVDHDTLILFNDLHEGPDTGVVGRGRQVRVMPDSELPGGFGLGKRLLEEVDLDLFVLVAVGSVLILVYRGAFLVAIDEAVGVQHNERSGPVFADDVIRVIWQLRLTRRSKIPATVEERCNCGLEFHPSIPFDDIVIAQALVPGQVLEDSFAVHVLPGFLEPDDAIRVQGHPTVVDVVPNSDLEPSSARSKEKR